MCCRFFTGDEEDDEELRAIIDALQRCGGGGAAVARDVLPTDTAAVIASSRRLSPGVFAMRWGFSGAGGAPVINARSETAHERPMFAESMASRRCLIPAGWYYEWERRGRERVRYAIRPEEAAGTLGVIELSDFRLRHDIMFLFPKNSNFRADYTAIFRELRACAEETGSA